MSNVILIRAAKTDFDVQNRIQGTLEIPVNEAGEAQLTKMVEALKGEEVDIILTSPTDPAKSTAHGIGKKLDIDVKELANLDNLDQGLWQGLEIDEVKRKYAKVFRQWEDAPDSVCPPEGETVSAAVKRIDTALKKRLKKKTTFAIVASEPLATLIHHYICGTDMERCPCSNEQEEDELVEFLSMQGNVKL